MSDRTLRYVAWALCAIFALSGAVAIAIEGLNRPAGDSTSEMLANAVNALVIVAFVAVGTLLVSKQPRNAIGWLLLSTGLVSVGVLLDFYYTTLPSAPAEPSLLFLLGAWLASWVWIMVLFPAFFIPLLFPTGRPPSPRWRWLVPLGLVYFGSVIVLQRLLSPITGESTVAVVLSTLLIAALFLPLRRRVQDIIDRRFFRQKYDAEQVLEQFAATVRDETDLDELTAELVRVIQETMQPESVTVWLREQEQ